MPKYYPINEEAARRAKNANSFSDYVPGSATAAYREMVDRAYALGEQQKGRVDPMYHEKIDGLIDRYARKLAENINQSNLIDARVPSILIAGGSNFPVRKKEKQNAARDKNMGEYMQIEGLLDKVRSTGMGGISADDDRAVEKLEAKLAGLEAMQEEMKTVNAYYRKHKTLEGCPVLSAEEIGKLQSSMASDWRKNPVPYPSYLLTNNNANIRRTRQRIEDLKSQSEYAGWAFPGGRAEINEGENRLQLFFEEKPSEEQRRELKSNGFKWAPSQGAWQRQLTKNAIYAAGRMEFLRPEDGQSPYQLQPFARKTEKDVKHPKDKHQLIIDPDAAEIVKLIFSLFLKGTSKRAIALYLNEHGVPSPSAYKLQKGIPVSTRGYDDPMWGARMIHSILTNPTYTGDLAQGRSRVKSYKVHEVESVPREEWVEVAGTHEAIIDYETFDKVQALLQRDTRTSPKGREVHLFSGFLKCADCGRAITRSVGNNNNVYYACSTYKNRSRTACTMHSIKHKRLEAAVLFAVQQQIHLAVSYSEMIARINTAPVKKSQSIRLEELIAAKERELAKISRYKQSLYQDWKDGEITQQDYRDMKADYERQTIALTDVLARLNAERAELANGVKSEHPALVAFTKHQNIDQLSRELLVELIDHIKVYENGNISVRFKFADEFRRIAEYIEINTTKPAVAG